MFVVRSQLGLGETCQHCDHIFASAVPAVLLPFSPVVYPLKFPVFTGCLEDVMYSKIGSHVLQTRVLMLRIASSHLSPDHLVRSNPGSWVRRVLRRAQPTWSRPHLSSLTCASRTYARGQIYSSVIDFLAGRADLADFGLCARAPVLGRVDWA